jgi:hypothetical protein
MTDAQAREAAARLFKTRHRTPSAERFAELLLKRAWQNERATPRKPPPPPLPRHALPEHLDAVCAYVHSRRGVTLGDVAQRFGVDEERADDLLQQLTKRKQIKCDNSLGVSIWDGRA